MENLAKTFNPMDNKILLVFADEKVVPEFDVFVHTGFDLKIMEDAILAPKQPVIVPTGCKWAAPLSVYMTIHPRSGLSYKTHIRISNTPGTIECSYRGDISLILEYNKCIPKQKKDPLKFTKIKNQLSKHKIKVLTSGKVKVPKYSRLAQAIIQLVVKPGVMIKNVYEVYYTISPELYTFWEQVCPSQRNAKGFGSTGV